LSGVCVDEADGVSERILGIEAALAPRSDLDRGDVSSAALSHPLVNALQVIDAEIRVVRIWSELLGITIGECVVTGKDRAPQGKEWRPAETRSPGRPKTSA
jgi:hypothetical protein